jgi:hypothetical protein
MYFSVTHLIHLQSKYDYSMKSDVINLNLQLIIYFLAGIFREKQIFPNEKNDSVNRETNFY